MLPTRSLVAATILFGSATSAAEENTYDSLKFRALGPAFFSGRISDFAVVPEKPHTYYVGVASGGLWKTTNNGITWKPIFDDQGSYAIGVVELDPKHPHTVWVGTGENNAQRSVGWGDGVYKSRDGGKNWTHTGLKNSGHIGQIAIHPESSETVFVAAQGPLWSSGGDRGVYKTTDGGKAWKRVLHVDDDTGANEVIIHPDRPDHLIASTYQRRRHVWVLINGGPGSGIHKSTDGGDTWRELTEGLPKHEKGRIGIALAPSHPDTVYAIVEAAPTDESSPEKRKKTGPGVYKSTNFGETWTKVSDHMSNSPQYYNELVVDPKNPSRLYSLDTFTHVSHDGGKTWTKLAIERKHVDDHALWIDPNNTAHLRMGSDGGIYESYDRGTTWGHVHNLPLGQFYRIAADNRSPFYFVCGGTQDNNTVCGPSRTTEEEGITNEDWSVIVGGDGYEPQIDPTDPNIIYAQYQYGGLARYDATTGERVFIAPQPASGENELNWNWNTPLIISPHDPARLYYGAEKLFRSDDRGDSWRAVSPDLTRRLNRNQMEVMGRVWSIDAVAKNNSTSKYGSLIAVSESPLREGLLYAGTDDGLIHVSDTGDTRWRRVSSFPGVPDMSLVEDIDASLHDADTAYAVFDNHKRGDFKPYVLKTINRGKSWTSIAGDLPRGPAHAIVEDTHNANLLFVGTEWGLYFTQDGGDTWRQLEGDLPTIDVRDLEIQRRDDDLLVGTFGRGIYVLDSIAPLRTPASRLESAEATLFAAEDAWLYVERNRYSRAHRRGHNFWTASNPPFGAVFTYYLAKDVDSRRETRRRLERERLARGQNNPYPSWEELRREDREMEPAIVLIVKDAEDRVVRHVTGPRQKGFHRVAWDLRLPPTDPIDLSPKKLAPWQSPPMGPLVLPGTYTVTLNKRIEGKTIPLSGPQTVVVKPVDAKSPLVTNDRDALLAFERKTAELSRAVKGAVASLDEARARIGHLERALDLTPSAGWGLRDRLTGIDGRARDLAVLLTGDKTVSGRNEPVPWSISRRVNSIISGHWRSQAAVTDTHRRAYDIASAELKVALGKLRLLAVHLRALESQLEQLGAPWTPGRVPTLPDTP